MADDGNPKLGIEIESNGYDKVNPELKEFTKNADDAAKSADNLNKTASGGADGLKKQAGAADEPKAAIAGMSDAQLGAATVIGALTVAAGAAAVAVGVMAYQWSSAQQKIEQSLIGIGARTG